MKESVFTFKDYKTFLKACIREGQPKWGYVSKMADMAGCQRSYLSRVLNSEVHLTPDHLYNIGRFLALNDSESEYLLNLLESERASLPEYRSRIDKKLAKLKIDHENLQNKVKRPAAPFSEREFIYYSDWIFSALHIIVSIPQFQTSRAIAEHLHLPVKDVEARLQILKQWNLVKYENRKWLFGGSELHVQKNSPLVSLHHNNWRQRAVLKAQSPNEKNVHFTVVQSVDAQAWDKIRSKLIKFIEEASHIANPAKEEKLICLTCDCFEV